MTRLRDLDGRFLKLLDHDGNSFQHEGVTLAEAHGVQFLCPKCFAANGGPIGTHSVICWFDGVAAHIEPKPGRWNPQGTSIDDLTFVGPRACSVLLTSGCEWHGFVRDGDAT